MTDRCPECEARDAAIRSAQATADAELDALIRHAAFLAVLVCLIWAWRSGVIARVGQILKEV